MKISSNLLELAVWIVIIFPENIDNIRKNMHKIYKMQAKEGGGTLMWEEI